MKNSQYPKPVTEPKCPVCGATMSFTSIWPVRFSNGQSDNVVTFLCSGCRVENEKIVKGVHPARSEMTIVCQDINPIAKPPPLAGRLQTFDVCGNEVTNLGELK